MLCDGAQKLGAATTAAQRRLKQHGNNNGRVICTGDELWAVAPERADLLELGGSELVVVWPKSRTVVYGAAKYPPLTIEQLDALKAL